MRAMRVLLLALMLALSLPAAAQQGRKGEPGAQPGQRGHGQHMSSEDRRRLRDDVNSARRDYGREDRQRQDRMAPEEREKLRRDVQDANRDLRRR